MKRDNLRNWLPLLVLVYDASVVERSAIELLISSHSGIFQVLALVQGEKAKKRTRHMGGFSF
jgi:hypothetical protein